MGWLSGRLSGQDREDILKEGETRKTTSMLPKTELMSPAGYPWDSRSDFTFSSRPPPRDARPLVPSASQQRPFAVVSRNRSPEQHSAGVSRAGRAAAADLSPVEQLPLMLSPAEQLPLMLSPGEQLPLMMLSPEQEERLSRLEEKYAEERRQILLSHRSEKYSALLPSGPSQQVQQQPQQPRAWSGSVWGSSPAPPPAVYDTAGWPPHQQQHQQPGRIPVFGFSPAAATNDNVYPGNSTPSSPRTPVNPTMDHQRGVPAMRRAVSQPSMARLEALGVDAAPPSNGRRLLLPSQFERKRLHPSQVERSRLLQEQARNRAAAAAASRLSPPGAIRWSSAAVSSPGTGGDGAIRWSTAAVSSPGTGGDGAIRWSTAGVSGIGSGRGGAFLYEEDEDQTPDTANLRQPAGHTGHAPNSTAAVDNFQMFRRKDVIDSNLSQTSDNTAYTVVTTSEGHTESYHPQQPVLQWAGSARQQGVAMRRVSLFDPDSAPSDDAAVSETPPGSSSWRPQFRIASGTVHKSPELARLGPVQSLAVSSNPAEPLLGWGSAGAGGAGGGAELGLLNCFHQQPRLFPGLTQQADRIHEVNPLSSPR